MAVISAEIFHPENAKLIAQTKNKKIYKPIKDFNTVVREYGYPIISKEVAQRIHGLRNAQTCGRWVRAILGIGPIRPIPKKYIHIVDKEFNKNIEASHQCCNLIKGAVKHSPSPKFVGTTIHESKLRRSSWVKDGCNVYKKKHLMCRPISLWTEEDVKRYINENNVKVSKAYEMGWTRTGCISCGFGMNLEQAIKNKYPNFKTRFDLLYENYRQIYIHFMYEVGVADALIMSGVKLTNGDERYYEKYQEWKYKMDDWNTNIEKNINKILDQIEQQTNAADNPNKGIAGSESYKGDYYIKKNQNLKFTKEERQAIIERYK